jgi:hypothetical protein
MAWSIVCRRGLLVAWCLTVAGVVPAAAQSPQADHCDTSVSAHQNYRTQDTLLVLPNGTSSPTLFVGIEHKGVFTSTDGGTTWARSDTGLRGYPRQGSESDRCIRELGRIVADPGDLSHLYLLRVETPGRLDMLHSETGGIFESHDAGATWTQLTGYGNAAGGHGLAVIAGTSGAPATVFMGVGNSQASWGGAPEGFYNTTGIIYRSTNGGQSWTELDQRASGSARIEDYLGISQIFASANGQRLWAPTYLRSSTGAMGVDTGQIGFFESTDGGTTWTRGTTRLTDPLTDPAGRAGINGDVAPTNFDHRLLIATQTVTSPVQAYTWYTLDGQTWRKSSRYVYVARYSPHDAAGLTLFGYDPFAGSPSDPQQGILRSVDGGASWTRIAALPEGVDNESSGVRLSNFAFHPTDANIIYASGSGARVWRSTDAGVTWTTLLELNSPVIGGPNTSTPTAPGAPGAPAASSVAGQAVSVQRLTWTAPVTGGLPTSYRAEVSLTPDFASVQAFTSATTSVDVTLPQRGAYYARVVAINTVGESVSSSVSPISRLVPSVDALRFGGTRTGGGELTVTAAQRVTVSFTSTSGAWTATTTTPWLQVTGGTGAGPGQFTVTVVNPEVIGAATSLDGTITITSSAPALSARVTVQLTVQSTTTPPAGQVDTPLQSATGVQGAIAITGWAVDDVGIAHVRIYRQCLDIDNPDACQTVLGTRVVFVGEASVISGARPDVEAQYPALPAANSAGWGFLILSNLLPNIPGANANGGGVGTFTLYAVATDQEGNQTLLGRTVSDATPTTVTIANDTIAKPFGAIDTPGQGATVSGTLNNFGWALTPDSNTVADGTDILVPTAGTTVTVFIDGAVVGTATYNLCRGTVGNPVPSGVLCDDDVSSIFRGAGLYRNLDAARGAIALRTISTLALTNGLHTIQWGVSDSASRSEGIGSRYFNVLNSAGDAGDAGDAGGGGLRPGAAGAAGAAAFVARRNLPRRDDVAIFGRTGFNLDRAFVPVEPVGGVPSVVVPELGRVELRVPGARGVAMVVANGDLRAAPVGLAVDDVEGVVTWSVGPGYLGTYRHLVERDDDQVLVDVTVAPMAVVEEPVRMQLDEVRSAACGVRSAQCGVRIEGWALDPQAETGSGIGAVHIWATRRSADCGVRSAGCGPVFLGVADLGVSRPDVAAAHGARFPYAGFTFQAGLSVGEWDVTAYVWNVRTQRFEDARSVSVTIR